MSQQSPRYRRDHIRTALHARSEWEVLVQNPDPGTCFGQLTARLNEPVDRVCLHVERGGPWYRLLVQPGVTMCRRCLPPGYGLFLLTGQGLEMECECCGVENWLEKLTYLETAQGTVLALLCRECAAQDAAGLVTV